MEKALNDLNGMLQRCSELYSAGIGGGKMRSLRGDCLEQFVRDTINNTGILTAKKGSEDKKELKVTIDSVELKKEHQVDVHVYLNDEFIAVIECKSYLDSCFYVRACDDFRLFKKFGYKVKNYIVALEDCIDRNTMRFIDYCNDNICDKVFFLLDGKRQASKPIFDAKFTKPVNESALREFVELIKTYSTSSTKS